MRKKAVRRIGTVLLVLAASINLSTCGSTTPDTIAPTAIAVKRYTADGALDTANFGGTTGAVATKIVAAEFEYALAVALQADGKIIAAGHSVLAGQGVIALVRYNTDGSLDVANFGTGGIVRTAIPLVSAVGTAIALQGTQILVAGSTFNPSTGMTGIAVVRYNANGLLDTAGFGTGGIVSAEIGPGTDTDTVSLALQGTDIVVAGATSSGNFVLRRYDANGVLDTANFGTNGTGGTVTTNVGSSAMGPAIALQSDGKIIAAGASGSFDVLPTEAVLVRYNPNGTLDLPFGGAGTGMVFTDTVPSSNTFANAVVVQPADDKIVVAGHAFVDFNADTSDIIVIRYDADGTLDSTFGSGGAVVTNLAGAFDNAFSVALQPTGEILVSGNTGAGGIPRVAVLRYTAGGALDSSFGSGGVVTTSATGPSSIASGNAVVVQSDGSIVVAGYD